MFEMGRRFIVYFYIVLFATKLSANIWTEEDVLHWEETSGPKHGSKPIAKVIEICSDPELCGHDKSESKRMETPDELLTSFSSPASDEPFLNYFPSLFHKQPSYCSCGRKKRLIDLGPNYFPRYYSDMVCLPGGCGNFACSPKPFKFWALKKRQEADSKPGSEPVPVELRDHWIAESIVTTIDCECRP